uniref:Hypothetical_protein n=1 Tax=Oryza brachyantha TaxID=4533 RepID=G2XM76_ORYBR|nr:hypothetical_protein [Oryza brachyantha]
MQKCGCCCTYVFSIRSSEDLGVGELLDLKLHVDWAVNSGFHPVKLLPIDDTIVNGMISIQQSNWCYLLDGGGDPLVPNKMSRELKNADLRTV